MQKVKLNIKGMHCKACSRLIEGELSGHKGVSMAKVNDETGKAVVIFDENKINKSEINKLVSKAGDYKVEGDDDKEEDRPQKKKSKSKADKIDIFFKLIMILIALAVLVIVIMYLGSKKEMNESSSNVTGNRNAVSNDRLAPTPTPSKKPAQAGRIDIEVTKDDHIRGNINAPVTIIEFSDFQCSYCSRFHGTMKQVVANYPNEVRWVYKHFPLDSIHPLARKAAEASECAGDQDKFWEYADALFANSQGLSESTLTSIAKSIGLNTRKFDSCLASGDYADKVDADYQAGIKAGVRGTPGNFINGESIAGAVPYESLKTIIEEALQQ